MSEIRELCESIERFKSEGLFKNYIEYIHFPYYKRILPGSRINFDFPLTVLVGKNGTNKSSVLKALYGAPYGYSTGKYWFSTVTDPINENHILSNKRNRFFYGYRIDGSSEISEVLKQRAKSKKDPDNWDAVDPLPSLGMITETRMPPVNKNVIYMDFRSELSAFDKTLYFEEPKEETSKELIRRRATYLSQAFLKRKVSFPGPYEKRQDELVVFTRDEVRAVSKILGKEYKEIKYLRHKYFNKWGISVQLTSKTKGLLNYTESNAGSGEFSVARLVHTILNAKDNSLILLDEPEISLHPGAQSELLHFLLNEIKKHKHQIILTTHSKSIIQDLPVSAIKLFHEDTSIIDKAENIRILEDIDYRIAFTEIGIANETRITIKCEDYMAQVLIEKVLKINNINKFFSVSFTHGGASQISQRLVPVYAIDKEMKDKTFIIFDGDMECDSIDTAQLTAEVLGSPDELKELVKRVFHDTELKPFQDGGNGGRRSDNAVDSYKAYLDFHRKNIGYLPNRKIPEAIVLNSTYVIERYSIILSNFPEGISNQNAKQILREISSVRYEDDVNMTFNALLTELVNENTSEDIKLLSELLRGIFDRKMILKNEKDSLVNV